MLKAYVIKRLRQILLLEGYDPEEFSGHSIRIGGCQSLFAVEVDLRNIACAGRWSKVRKPSGSTAKSLERPALTGPAPDHPPGGATHSEYRGTEGSCKGSGLFGWR